ncbi:MAG: hypothetical protein AAF620_04645 [Bacteroidota bacterium]
MSISFQIDFKITVLAVKFAESSDCSLGLSFVEPTTRGDGWGTTTSQRRSPGGYPHAGKVWQGYDQMQQVRVREDLNGS